MTQDDRQQVLACYWELACGFTPLSSKYGPAVLIAALVEHVGGSLRLALESGAFTESDAREVVELVKRYAFHDLVQAPIR